MPAAKPPAAGRLDGLRPFCNHSLCLVGRRGAVFCCRAVARRPGRPPATLVARRLCHRMLRREPPLHMRPNPMPPASQLIKPHPPPYTRHREQPHQPTHRAPWPPFADESTRAKKRPPSTERKDALLPVSSPDHGLPAPDTRAGGNNGAAMPTSGPGRRAPRRLLHRPAR